VDPRGIVAAATASTFSASLVSDGVGGASDILPATFLVIVGTVTLYGLTAAPVARWLGVTRPAASLPLIVGGSKWVVDLARALRAQGLEVLMWAGAHDQRRQIQDAGLPLAPGRLLADATGSGAELFVVHPGGRLDPVTAGKTPQPQDGDMLVLLGPVPQRPAPTRAPGSAASSRRGDDGARER
jgi:hypothetical protein